MIPGKYAALARRVEDVVNRGRPMKVYFRTVHPGEQPEPAPADAPVVFTTYYMSREETERDRDRGYVRPEAR